MVALILFVLLASGSQAFAFYDKVDRAEAIYILPDESFFWVPDVGDNKNSQVKLNSEEYYAANKLPVKRFVIPHVKFAGSSAVWFDFYVPSGRAIIQPRTPYNREWTKDSKRGTSPRDESFPCQDSQGINVTVEIGIGAYVTEEQAPRYLSTFGVKPPKGNREDPQIVFTSIYYGKDLPEVMDGVIRTKIQTLVCGEISSRPLDRVNSEANAIMKKITDDATNYCTSKGITLDYIGWAGTFTFDKDVQAAINDRYTAQAIAPYLPTLETKALIDALNRWDGHAPTTVSLWWLPSGIGDFFSRMFKSESKVQGEEAPKVDVHKK
jgi:SPFH domain / Band 7 family